MFKLKQKIQTQSVNSWQFSVSGSRYAFLSTENKVVVCENDKTVFTCTQQKVSKIILNGDMLIILNDITNCIAYNISNGVEIHYPLEYNEHFLPGQNFDNDLLLVEKSKSILDVKTGLFDTLTNEKKYYPDFYPSVIYNSREIYGFIENTVSRYNEDGNTLWTHTISTSELEPHQQEGADVLQDFLAINERQLFVAGNNGRLLILDTQTGNLIYHWQKLEGFYTDVSYLAGKMPPPEIFSLDKTSHKLIGGFVYSYLEIDLETKVVTEYSLKEELDKYGITTIKTTQHNPFTATHLFLTVSFAMKSGHEGFTYDGLISLNRHTKQIDWLYKFEGMGLGLNSPHLSDGILYQLDNKGGLHIFEINS